MSPLYFLKSATFYQFRRPDFATLADLALNEEREWRKF